jgi:hypothetical protein
MMRTEVSRRCNRYVCHQRRHVYINILEQNISQYDTLAYTFDEKNSQ